MHPTPFPPAARSTRLRVHGARASNQQLACFARCKTFHMRRARQTSWKLCYAQEPLLDELVNLGSMRKARQIRQVRQARQARQAMQGQCDRKLAL